MPHVRLSVRGPNKTGEAPRQLLARQSAKSNRNISFLAHVRFGERGAPVQFLRGSVRKLTPVRLSSHADSKAPVNTAFWREAARCLGRRVTAIFPVQSVVTGITSNFLSTAILLNSSVRSVAPRLNSFQTTIANARRPVVDAHPTASSMIFEFAVA